MGFKALYTGVSGLLSQSRKLEVIGNNLANVNTTGFKKDRVNFHDVYYQSLKHATQGDGASLGGTNPQEIGAGVQIGSIDKIFTQGSKEVSERSLDFMVEGDDFFVVENSATSELMLTRNGSFQLDGDFNLIDNFGNMVQGFNVNNETGAVAQVAADIVIDTTSIGATATTNVTLDSNIDSASVESPASLITNAWEVFSGGENFGNMSTAVSGSSGSRTTFGSGFYQDSFYYSDAAASINAALDTITLQTTPANLIEGFNVGDTISLLQGSVQVQRTISAINTGSRTITVSAAAPATFSSASTISVANLTQGTTTRGHSGTTTAHNDVLESQISMIDATGNLIASFYRVTGSPSDYTRATANISGGTTATIGTGEFTDIQELAELIERSLRDTQLTNYATSSNFDVTVDKFGAMTFSGTGLMNEFRLVMNANNTEMLDRFTGIAMTDTAAAATTQARVDSSGDVIAGPALALGARTVNASESWYDTSGLENYGFSSSNQATEYGEFAGLRLDGGANGNAYGTIQLSMVNGLGNTVSQLYTLVSRNPDISDHEFSTMGELTSLINTTLQSTNYSSMAENSALVADLTATATFTDGRLTIKTSNGSFNNLVIGAQNTSADTTNGIARTDQQNFGTVLGELTNGVYGKEGNSNLFINADATSLTRVYDSQGNEHTATSYFIRDRSSGLTNIEWKFKHGLQPNINTASTNNSTSQTSYKDTFNSITDTSTVRGVVGFDINTGAVIDGSATSADSRYSTTGILAFLPTENSVVAQSAAITIDYTALTSYNGDNSIDGTNVNGYALGNLLRMSTEANTGNIQGVYSNGEIRTLAKVGLMDIDNPEALLKVGSSHFTQTANSNASGTIKGVDSIFSVAPTNGASTDDVNSRIHGNALEGSNVDVAQELTDMIVTQRSYSASGKVITTTDDMIQEALSLKR